MKGKRKKRIVVLVVKDMDKWIDRKGRIYVVFSDGAKGLLRARDIKDVYYHAGLFYVVYETQIPELYVKHSVKRIPKLAVWVEMWRVMHHDTGVRVIELRGDPVGEAREFIEKLLDVRCEPVDRLYGFVPMFSLDKVNVELFTVTIKRLAVVENPVFKKIDNEKDEKAYQGRFLVAELVEKDTVNKLYVLFRTEEEPDRDILEKLKRGMVE
ncbi:MAG: hypothetical protein JHC26_11865 [Thermofilum sp.]|uniref:hypothetical protein n=1 Tax=Thermofilum sp. TaxID=1961369 RepID=UPI002585A6C8|nr:hypothetical protein [Thermofilum sp.]MCI4409780.1 hypothetical protein [Thermofilum sp.]